MDRPSANDAHSQTRLAVGEFAPLVEELHPAPDAERVFLQLCHLPHCLFLDSASRDPALGRYSFVAADPYEFIELPPTACDALAELSGRLQGGLAELGAAVVTPGEPGQRGGIVSFHWGAGIEDERAAWSALKDAGVQLSLRYGGGIGGLRAAVHFYNDESDVDQLLEELRLL